MHWADIVALVLITWFVIRGIISGLIMSLFRLAGIIAGIIVAIKFQYDVMQWLLAQFPTFPDQIASLVASSVIFMGVIILAQVLATAIKTLADFALLSWLDKLGGLLIGFFKAILLISLIYWGMTLLPANSIVQSIQRDTVSYQLFGNAAPAAYDSLIRPFIGKGTFDEQLEIFGKKFQEAYFPESATPDNLIRLLERSGKFSSKEIEILRDNYENIPQAEKERIFGMLRGTDIEQLKALRELLEK
ncbi:MAG TPA: CvpA family protein [Candidatus Marinimicrobia bacterium]|nr:CvpA family protein [Candidatus Neomarinimicrobiota bacterium]